VDVYSQGGLHFVSSVPRYLVVRLDFLKFGKPVFVCESYDLSNKMLRVSFDGLIRSASLIVCFSSYCIIS
jgi:hypothetical protein